MQKSKRRNLCRPCGVLNMVLSDDPSSSGICQNPLDASNIVKYWCVWDSSNDFLNGSHVIMLPLYCLVEVSGVDRDADFFCNFSS